MSFYVGATSYEILELTSNYMHVRAIQANDPGLAWYLKFTTSQGEEETEEFVSEFDNLFGKLILIQTVRWIRTPGIMKLEIIMAGVIMKASIIRKITL